jgi:BMFP domain-containing protein YqiC
MFFLVLTQILTFQDQDVIVRNMFRFISVVLCETRTTHAGLETKLSL